MESKASRVKIDLSAGTIELEGSETFVSKYLDEFKDKIGAVSPSVTNDAPGNIHNPEPKMNKKDASPKARGTEKKRPSPTKQVKAEAFETKPEGKPALESFFATKGLPASHSRRIAIVGYYLTQILGREYFTEGNIEFAYKVLKINRPKYVRQACIDAKNQQQYLETVDRGEGEPSAWNVSRLGQIYVEDEAKA